MHDIEVSTRIDAPADQVWALIGDPTRMEEFSPEVHKVSWTGGATEPAVGAKFRGANRKGWHRWSTFCEVVEHDPGREIAWDVNFVVPISRWGYRIERDADGTGCTVTEYWDDRRAGLAKMGSLGMIARGVSDVKSHNRAGMEATLAAIKRVAEAKTAAA
jgi:hypothetical protein